VRRGFVPRGRERTINLAERYKVGVATVMTALGASRVRKSSGFALALDLPAHELLDRAPRDAFPHRFPQRKAPLAQVRFPLPHLLIRKGDQVEGLGVAVRREWRVVLYPNHGGGQAEVADNLSGELFGDVCNGRPFVGDQLRADDRGSVSLLLREVDAYPAPSLW
jgi:hypothetical protein